MKENQGNGPHEWDVNESCVGECCCQISPPAVGPSCGTEVAPVPISSAARMKHMGALDQRIFKGVHRANNLLDDRDASKNLPPSASHPRQLVRRGGPIAALWFLPWVVRWLGTWPGLFAAVMARLDRAVQHPERRSGLRWTAQLGAKPW